MKSNDLKNLILSLSKDIVFTYNNKNVCIIPFNKNKFEVGFGDKVRGFTNIEELMGNNFFDGKSLNEISNIIELDE